MLLRPNPLAFVTFQPTMKSAALLASAAAIVASAHAAPERRRTESKHQSRRASPRNAASDEAYDPYLGLAPKQQQQKPRQLQMLMTAEHQKLLQLLKHQLFLNPTLWIYSFFLTDHRLSLFA